MEKDDILEELEGIVGAEAANSLLNHYSGSNLYLPKNIKIKRNHRKIREEHKNGATYRELALRYGYTERYVRWILYGGSANKNA